MWSTTCGSCIREMPYLNDLYHNIDTTKIAFQGMIVNTNAKNFEMKYAELNPQFPQMIEGDQFNFKEQINRSSLPTTVLIDPEGNVITSDLRHNDLENMLGELNLLK